MIVEVTRFALNLVKPQKRTSTASVSETPMDAQFTSVSLSLISSRQLRHVPEKEEDQTEEVTLDLNVSYDVAVCSDLRCVLESLVHELSQFCQMESDEHGIGYERLHPLLLKLARFFQQNKDLIHQMTRFLLSNPDVLRCLIFVADSTLKGLLLIIILM